LDKACAKTLTSGTTMKSARNATAMPMMAQRIGAGSARTSAAGFTFRKLIDAVLDAPDRDGKAGGRMPPSGERLTRT